MTWAEYKKHIRAVVTEYGRQGILVGAMPIKFAPDEEISTKAGGRVFARDPRGTRYEVVGPAIDGRELAIICRIKSTGKLLFITTYAEP